MGHTVMVQETQSEKNRLALANHVTPVAGPARLYVGNLHVNITDDDLKLVFNPFGEIDFASVHTDPETGRSKGFGFVQFRRTDDAKKAMHQINGLELAGRHLKVGMVNDAKDTAGVYNELDDDDGAGLPLSAHSRAMLMAKLQRAQDGVAPPPVMPIVPIPVSNVQTTIASLPLNPIVASRCILLKNMFDPQKEADKDYLLEIRDDVEDECGKFGVVQSAKVDGNSEGFVYVKFATIDAAQKALNNLNHRWFAGKMITVEFFPETQYDRLNFN
eukprot:TRINITY_DN576_c0_g1_i1.p1 TRINITY_DN576_c0_g1~~TRINITY_DN576_c0_g1_i1.p1  ORF type:complete len:273 (-),score=64.90 TRINITY_DN576_c0_g1_i1:91-909(-)